MHIKILIFVVALGMPIMLTTKVSACGERSESAGPIPSNQQPQSTMNAEKYSVNRERILNINFGRQPFGTEAEGVIGEDGDHWNLIDVGQQTIQNVKFSDHSSSDVEVTLSSNDGEWGIAGHRGVFHAYLYHNCRCVDLQLTLRYLPPGRYYAFVYAHGDAPDQNAAIEIQSAGQSYKGKKTLNDGTMDFRNQLLTEGNQYVKYSIEVKDDSPVIITARRDGSSLSMFNAVQLVRLENKSQ